MRRRRDGERERREREREEETSDATHAERLSPALHFLCVFASPRENLFFRVP